VFTRFGPATESRNHNAALYLSRSFTESGRVAASILDSARCLQAIEGVVAATLAAA
jgi:hypothetical protein